MSLGRWANPPFEVQYDLGCAPLLIDRARKCGVDEVALESCQADACFHTAFMILNVLIRLGKNSRKRSFPKSL